MGRPKPHEVSLGLQHAGFRSGFVSIVGRPNVGKSTLLNQILRSKVAITSERPQTTRTIVRGIHTTQDSQIVFVDTPGLHKPRTTLGEHLNRAVRGALGDADVVVFVCDAADGVASGDKFIASELRRASRPVIVALNKIDLAVPADLAEAQERVAALGDWVQFPVSARTGRGVAELLRGLTERLPEGPAFYPPEMLTDVPLEMRIAELVREKALELTHEEVPHSIAVVVDEIRRDDARDLVEIDGTIYVERPSQKAIVIGKGGTLLREIGTRARPEIEDLVGGHVFLGLHVKVERNWQRRAALVERFGYGP